MNTMAMPTGSDFPPPLGLGVSIPMMGTMSMQIYEFER